MYADKIATVADSMNFEIGVLHVPTYYIVNMFLKND